MTQLLYKYLSFVPFPEAKPFVLFILYPTFISTVIHFDTPAPWLLFISLLSF